MAWDLRVEHEVLGVSQRVARMESGEQNPDFETIVAVVALLGTEFCLDVAPAGADATLVTKGASRPGRWSPTVASRS